MPTPDTWLGVDLGTSALKIVALDAAGQERSVHETKLPLHESAEGRVEAPPQAWEEAVRAGLSRLDGSYSGAGLGVTGQMHGTVLVSADGSPVGPAVLWPDRRAVDQAPYWQALPGAQRARLGSPFSPGMTGPVLGWLGRHEPQRLVGVVRVLLPKDWVRSRLTGAGPDVAVTDPSDASATLLWDVVEGAWSAPAVAAAGLAPELLPGVVDSTAVVGAWSPAEGRDVPVVAGAGDTPASLLALQTAVGGWRRGDVVVNLGTGAQVIAPEYDAAPDEHPDRHVYADASGGRYAMVAVQNAGLALDWVSDRLGLRWPELAAAAQRAAPGADGVLFAPYVSAERGRLASWATAPGWSGADRDGGAATAGGTDVTVRVRAAAEAQAFVVRRAYELLDAPAERVLLVGGGGRDRWVQQLLADVLGLVVHRVELRSAAATGAAVLAAAAAGHELPVPASTRRVGPQRVPALEEAYARWCAHLYPG